jgi:hypothetical protein
MKTDKNLVIPTERGFLRDEESAFIGVHLHLPAFIGGYKRF